VVVVGGGWVVGGGGGGGGGGRGQFRSILLHVSQGLKRGVVSLEMGGSLEIFYYLGTSEIRPNKRNDLCREWHIKWNGLCREWHIKRENTVLYI
jgi:hypothetical protein